MHLHVRDKKGAEKLQSLLDSGDVLLLYYWDACGYCITFMNSAWKEIVAANFVATAQIEYSHLSLLSSAKTQHKWTSFPTLVLFHKGVAHTYDNTKPRTVTNIQKFVKTVTRKAQGGAKTARKASKRKTAKRKTSKRKTSKRKKNK